MTAALPGRPELRLGPILDLAWLGLVSLPLIAVEHALADPAEWTGYIAYSALPVLGCAVVVTWAPRDPRIARAAAWGVGAFFFVISAAFVAALLTWGHYPFYARQAAFSGPAFAVGIVWNSIYLATAAAVLAWLWRSRHPPAQAGRPALVLADHHRDVRTYCLARTCDPSLADDLAQDVFVIALRRAPDYRGDAPVRAWLMGIARNVVRTHHRDRAVARRALDRLAAEPPPLPPAAADPEARASLSQQIALLRRARRRLPDLDAEAVRMRYEEELTSREAAQRLGTTPGAFRVRLHRALRRLGGWLS